MEAAAPPGPERADPEGQDDDAIYVFCFARESAAAAMAGAGLDEASPLRTLARGDVAAVVCDVPLAAWTGAQGEANLQDIAWLGPRALRHEHVIEQVMRASPVLPLRFGCLFSSAERLASLLEREGPRIARFLDEAERREEWSIRGLLDVDACAEALFAEDPRAAKLPASKGARYLMEQKLRKDASQAARSFVKTAESEVAVALGDLAIARRALKAAPRQQKGKTLEGAFHWALLAPRGSEEELARRLDDLGARLAERGLRLEANGPWPLYHFTPSFDDIDGPEARAEGEAPEGPEDPPHE